MAKNTWENTEHIAIPEEALRQTLQNEPPSIGEKLYHFAERSPFLVAGMAGLITVCGIGAYKWRTKKIKPSLFLMQLRVAAQGTALGCITLGMAYNMYKNYMKKHENKSSS